MSQEGQIETAPRRRPRAKKASVAKKRAKTGSSKRSSRAKKSQVPVPVLNERYTPLLTRETFTFSRMRLDRGGPRVYSAICFPGWIRA